MGAPLRATACLVVANASHLPHDPPLPQQPARGMMMNNRVKLWLGASALALLSGALPTAPILSPMAADVAGISLAGDAWAQESGEGEEGTEAECTTESG